MGMLSCQTDAQPTRLTTIMPPTPVEFLQTCLDFKRRLKDCHFCRENNWTPSSGLYRGDCSGFILTLLKLHNPKLLHDLQQHSNNNRPKAFEIHNWLKQSPNGVNLRQQLTDIQPGQLLSWRKINPPKSGDTGHLAIVLEVLEVDQKNKLTFFREQHRGQHLENQLKNHREKSQRLSIKVLDLSKQAHDHDDLPRPGIACGWMQLTADDSGIVNGYIWSSELKKSKRTDIIIAAITAH